MRLTDKKLLSCEPDQPAPTKTKRHLTTDIKGNQREAVSRINARLLGRLDRHFLVWGSTRRGTTPTVFLSHSNRHLCLFLLRLHAVRRARKCQRRHVNRSPLQPLNNRTKNSPFFSAGNDAYRQRPSGFHADCTRRSLLDLACYHLAG